MGECCGLLQNDTHGPKGQHDFIMGGGQSSVVLVAYRWCVAVWYAWACVV
jgi:hypothetical protein